MAELNPVQIRAARCRSFTVGRCVPAIFLLFCLDPAGTRASSQVSSDDGRTSILSRSNTVIDVSETIALGVVTDTLAFWCGHPFICTRFTVRTLTALKGSGIDTFEFNRPGGAIGDTMTTAGHGPPPPTLGDTLVVMMSPCAPDGVVPPLLVSGGWVKLGRYSAPLQDLIEEIETRIRSVAPAELAADADLVVSGTFTTVRTDDQARDWGVTGTGTLLVDSVLVRRGGEVKAGDVLQIYIPAARVGSEWEPDGGSTPGLVHPSSFPAVVFLRRFDDAWRVLSTAHSIWRETSPDSMSVFVWPQRCSPGPYTTVKMDRPSLLHAIGG